MHVVLDIQRQFVDLDQNLDDTDVGKALQGNLFNQRAEWETKILELKEDMELAMREKDEELQTQINTERARFDANRKEAYTESGALKSAMKQVMDKKDAQYRALQAQVLQKLQRDEAGRAQALKEARKLGGKDSQNPSQGASMSISLLAPNRPKTVQEAKYDSLVQQYDRARTGDTSTGWFGLIGPESAAQQVEDLYRKVQAAARDMIPDLDTVDELMLQWTSVSAADIRLTKGNSYWNGGC